jgi:hypothetical protein|tara:strand:+ start:1081 stop:1527 length:447 start_codon:yes stop_codon:yes gene_type:complete
MDYFRIYETSHHIDRVLDEVVDPALTNLMRDHCDEAIAIYRRGFVNDRSVQMTEFAGIDIARLDPTTSAKLDKAVQGIFYLGNEAAGNIIEGMNNGDLSDEAERVTKNILGYIKDHLSIGAEYQGTGPDMIERIKRMPVVWRSPKSVL